LQIFIKIVAVLLITSHNFSVINSIQRRETVECYEIIKLMFHSLSLSLDIASSLKTGDSSRQMSSDFNIVCGGKITACEETKLI